MIALPVSISAAELARVRELREALYGIFAADGEPPRAALATLAATHAGAAAAGTLRRGDDGALRIDWTPRTPERVRFAVAEDAIALLADPDALARVARCPGRNCGWLFLNASGRRRWCSMDACGSREKMRRAYTRNRRTDE